MICEGCKHLCVEKGICYGSMNCEPDEVYCNLDLPADEQCEEYEEFSIGDYYDDYHDYLVDKGERYE